MTEWRGIVTVAPAMSSADAAPHAEGRPSVFLSYASEDRAAVRRLRDALEAAGVDAWYDENELTGGDAWDTKIRRQIRECTYFMPVISARASARLEGYFRREWRFALERMLDMADDVVFLLPIVIDEAQESSARVPEKFLTVQWLRVPDGDATKAFRDLARRLAAGGPHRLHHAPNARPAEKNSGPRAPQYLPPLDDDPPMPKQWWRWPRHFWKQLPGWVRFFGWMVIVVLLLNTCSRCTDSNPGSGAGNAGKSSRRAPQGTESSRHVAEVTKEVQDTLRSVGLAAANAAAAKRPADLVFLSGAANGGAGGVMNDLFGRFVTVSGVKSRLSVRPLKEGETAVQRATAENSRYAVSAVQLPGPDGKEVIRVALEQTRDGATAWTKDFPADQGSASISAEAYSQILPVVFKKE